MDLIFKQIVEALISQGGLSTVLLLLSLFVTFFIWKQLQGQIDKRALDTKACDDKITQLYEKRLEDQKAVLQALEKANAAQVALAQSVESRTASLQDLSVGFASLAQSIQASEELRKDNLRRVEATLDEIRRSAITRSRT